MKIENIKKAMKEYVDFFGSELLNRDEIDNCKTKKELAAIIVSHHDHIESRANDAQKSLERFSRQLGLENLT